MKAEAKEAPNRITIECYSGQADIVLAENIEIIDKEGEGFYAFDLYRLTVTDRPGLEQSVEDNFDAWLQAAKEAELAPVLKTIDERVDTVEVTQQEVVGILALLAGV